MIRVVTLNIWQEQGPWQQRMDLLKRRLAALAPDVICLQEVRQVPGRIPNQAQTLAAALQMNYLFEVTQPWGEGDEGLAILSRFTIHRRDFCELPSVTQDSRRICLGAEIATIEGLAWFFTTHLAYRLTDGLIREQQVCTLDQFVQNHHRTGVASVLTGDFNARPEADEIRFLKGLTTLQNRRTYYQDAFAQLNPGALGYTWCKENPYTAPLDWLEPDRRLDYIFVTPRTKAGAGQIMSCRIVCSGPDERGVRCSDHYGLLAEMTVAPSSQRA
jgi:endonuclease/exonuclease/phosphatase family metal-dependent hydrolase